MQNLLRWLIVGLAAVCLCACHQLDDQRVPNLKVNINLGDQGTWDAYGAKGYGDFNYFIFTTSIREPHGFPYTYNSGTGYGGVLLVWGQNPFTGDVGPLAFDLSCPVERMPDVRIYMDFNTLEAVCPECGSHYDVEEAYGAPASGPAQTLHYSLRPYQCFPTSLGGYIISN